MSNKYRGRKSAYTVADAERTERIEKDARRNWARHPEIRSENHGSFERYLRSIHHNITHG